MRDGAPRCLLAVEAATDAISVAVVADGALRSLATRDGVRQHSSALLGMIDEALGQAGVGLAGIDAIAVSSGPGSFTSLRIALATVKGLAFGRSLPVLGVSTLEAMACAVLEDGDHGAAEVLALLDARRGEWYAGSWRRGTAAGLPEVALAAGLYAPQRLARDLARPVVVVGPELSDRVADFTAAGLAATGWILGAPARPRADWVARLALPRLARGEGQSAAALTARYLRRAQAEAVRTGEAVEAGETARTGSPDPDVPIGARAEPDRGRARRLVPALASAKNVA